MQITINDGLKSLITLKIKELTPTQGELKVLTKDNYEKIKGLILQKGFCFPMFVWRNEGKNYIIDGHQRWKVFVDEGWQDIDVPCVFIDAESMNDAKEKLLACTSQFGTITLEGLGQFIEGLDWSWVDSFLNFDALPILDFSDIKDPENYQLKEPEYKKEPKEKSQETCKCPNCGHEFEV